MPEEENETPFLFPAPFLLMEEADFARELPTIRTDDGRRKEVIAFCPT
jgi:hypothetical protein